MIPCYYTRLHLRQLSLSDLRRYFAEWALGVGRFGNLHRRRLEVGVPSNLRAEQLERSATHHGHFEARLDVRATAQRWLLHLSHRDSAEPAVLWHNLVRLETANPGVVLQHGVGRSVPPGDPPRIVVAPPAVVQRVIEWNGPDLAPRDIVDSSLLDLPAADAADFADYILCERERGVPMLVFTAGTRQIVDGSLVDRALVGLTRVVRATESEVAAAISSHLLRRGFDRRFSLLDGSVRLFLPGLAPNDDPFRHRLWIADRLAGMGASPAERAAVLTRDVAQIILRRSMPPAYFASVARHDREQHEETRRSLLSAAALLGGAEESVVQLVSARRLAKELEDLVAAQAEEIKGLQAANDQLEYDKVDLGDQLSAAAQQREELEGEIKSKKAALDHQGVEMDKLKMAAASPDLPQATRDAIAAAVLGSASISQGLQALQALFPDRVTVLPTAMRSAHASRDFKYASRALELMLKFGTEYWMALRDGEGDGAGRRIFGQAFAATESETVMRNEKARKLRTFRYREDDVLMCPHLKIGVKESSSETWRMHFEWRASEGRLIIGHCGPHLDHS